MSKSHVSLIIKGPVKNAKRAAARRGVHLSDCRKVGAEVQCYAPCSGQTMNKVIYWYTERTGKPKAGRGHSPGTLLYHGACSVSSLKGAKQEPPPVYFQRKGPPPGVKVHAGMLKGSRKRKRR